MTILEVTCRKLLGPPSSSHGNGESYWPCPKCGGSRFHTMPHKPEFRDRFKCWSCDFRGDIHDLLQHFYPREDYGRRLARIADLREEFTHQLATFPSGDSAGSSNRATDPTGPIAVAWADLTGEETRVLRNLYTRSLRDKFSLDDLGKYDADFAAWILETDRQHLSECDDPNCEAQVCQQARAVAQDPDRAIREIREWESNPFPFSLWSGGFEMIDEAALMKAVQHVLDYASSYSTEPETLSNSLRVAQRALALCAERGLSPAELAWRLGRESEHLLERGEPYVGCDSASCPNVHCRLLTAKLGRGATCR